MMCVKENLKGVFGILFFSLLIALSVNYISPAGISLMGQWDTDKGVVSARAKNDAVQSDIEINNPLKVLDIVNGKKMMVLDVRPGIAYEQGHIPGARSFPLEEFDDILKNLMPLVEKDTPILVYCSGFECSDSHTFAGRLRALRFSKVSVYGGGFRQWQEMGFEIE